MFNFIAGAVFGIVVSTIGVNGVMKYMNDAAPTVDKGVKQAQKVLKENIK